LVKIKTDGLKELKQLNIRDTIQKHLKGLKKENPEYYP